MGTKLLQQFLVGLLSLLTFYSLRTWFLSAQVASLSTQSAIGLSRAFEKRIMHMLEDSDSDDPAVVFNAPAAKKKAKLLASGSASSSENNLEFAMRGTLQSARFSYNSLKLPWETGFAGKVLGNKSSLPPALKFSAAQIPPVPKDVPLPMSNFVFPEHTNATARSRLKALKEPPSEDVLRDRAILKFRMLIEFDLEATEVGSQILGLLVTMAEVQEVSNLLHDVLNNKSTATLTKRANSLMKYILWAKSVNMYRPLLMEEPQIYHYLNHVRKAGCAPTMPWSFVRAVSFFGHTLGSLGAKHSAQSSRIKGLCDAEFVKKEPLKQARPLTVSEVMILENLCWNSPSCHDRVAAGQYCFDVYASARFSDPKRAAYLKLEVDENYEGFVELGTKSHKTATTVQKKTMFLPLIAQTKCLLQRSWAEGWIRAREATNLVIDEQPTLPAPSSFSDLWLERPLTAAEGTLWLRELLILGGAGKESVRDVSTHSLKTTALSWASKFGTELAVRRMLGHHSDPGMRSVLTYSRDAMSGPLSELSKIIEAIRNKEFLPDLPRHKRFPKAGPVVVDAEAVPPQQAWIDFDWGKEDEEHVELDEEGLPDFAWSTLEGPGAEKTDAVVKAAEEPLVDFECPVESDDSEGVLAGNTDSSEESDSSDSLSDSCINTPESDDENLASLSNSQAAPNSNFDCSKHSVFQHKHSGILHIRSTVGSLSLCNRIITSVYAKISVPLKFEWPNCKQCAMRLRSLEDVVTIADNPDQQNQSVA